jgi:SNW domain-containing protein 1
MPQPQSLPALLPRPKNAKDYQQAVPNMFAAEGIVATIDKGTIKDFSSDLSAVEPPAYRLRKDFVPRDVADFGDGGAFPEIHVLQYPLNMGRKDKNATGATTVAKRTALTVDAEGNIKYDGIIKQHMRKGFNVATTYMDLVEKPLDDDALAKPGIDEQQALAEKTRIAMGQAVDRQIAAAQPNNVKRDSKEAQIIRYTPATPKIEHNSGAQQRLIRLQSMPTDPLEPPQFKHKKLPQGPPSPPVPVMHSPPRKITVQDQQNWKIPSCVSNWKNIKGYTIPLDKRLTADGRGLSEVQVNDKFAKLSESLFVAERNARKEIEARATAMKKIMRKQKEVQEDQLREKAAQARRAGTAKAKLDDREGEDYEAAVKETEESVEQKAARDELRKDRQREIRRELTMENMSDDRKAKSKAVRDKDRDVSEQIALGKNVPTRKDGMFDQRLFNQDSGLASAAGGEDEYNVYDSTLFKGNAQNYIYRAKPNEEGMDEEELAKLISTSTSKFKPDQGFAGADRLPANPRDKPVSFEKEQQDDDPFGMGDLMGGNKRRSLDDIGKKGSMGASVTSSSDSYSREGRGSRAIDFDEPRGEKRRKT